MRPVDALARRGRAKGRWAAVGKWLGAAVWVLCQGLAPAWADSPSEVHPANDAAAMAFWWGDFAELERQQQKHRGDHGRDPGGIRTLEHFRAGLARVFNPDRAAVEAYYAELDALTRQWTLQHPASPLAHELHARSLYAHAWFHRGGGFANTVPPHAWADFQAYIGRAAQHLAAHSAVALKDTTAHVYLLMIGRAAGWSADRLWDIARDGLAKDPDDDGIYEEMLVGLLPRWGGSAVALDRFINEAATRTKADRGQALYALLYSAAARAEYEHGLLESTPVEWVKLKKGFDDLVARYPHASHLNRYAYFACLARDKPTFLDLLEKLGPEPVLDSWGKNPGRMFESCRRWAAAQ